MSSFPQMTATRREYHIKTWQKGLYLLLAAFSLAFGALPMAIAHHA